MRNIIRLIVPVFALALCLNVDAQVLGDLGASEMDERELYTMTKQMGQFINRFNCEEDAYGKRLYPSDSAYRNPAIRAKILPLLFDLDNPRTSGALRDFFVEDLTYGPCCALFTSTWKATEAGGGGGTAPGIVC